MSRGALPWLALALTVTAGGGGQAARAGERPATSIEPPRREAAPLVKGAFAGKFPFCTDAAFPLTADELAWCAYLPALPAGKPDDRCPRLAEACRRGATAQLVEGRRQALGGSRREVVIPPFVAWTLLGLGLAFVLQQIIRQSLVQVSIGAAGERERDADGHAAAPSSTSAAAARIVETDVQRLLERARAAGAAGDFRAAVQDAYAALLRKLEGAGVVRVEPGRTNGDHLREVAKKQPALRSSVGAVVQAVERVQFGGAPADEASFRRVLDSVVGVLNTALSAWLPLLIGVGLTAATLTGCAGLGRDAWDASPSGRAAVLSFLRQYGFEARDRLSPLMKVDASIDQLVLLPEATVEANDWAAIEEWVDGGKTLVVAGGTRTLPAFIPVALEADPSPVSAPLTVDRSQASRFGAASAIVPPGRRVTIDRDRDHEPRALLRRGAGLYAVEESYGDGRVVVLADDRLFENPSLLVGGNADLLAELLRPGGRRLELAGDLTGAAAPNPFASVERSRLAPALLQLALLVVLFFCWRGAHFGRPVDPVPSRRRAFAQHAQALGQQYARARASRHAVTQFATYALERLRERLRLPGGKGIGAVAEAVAARTGRPIGDVMRALVEARPDAAAAAAPDHDLAIMREIATLLADTGGGAGERNRVATVQRNV